MNILVIASKVGTTAPGIVFERLISGLSQKHTVDVVTVDNPNMLYLGDIRQLHVVPLKLKYVRVEKFFISSFCTSLTDTLWRNKVCKLRLLKFDCILSLVSSFNTHALAAGKDLSRRQGVPHYTYFVDAIPAPNGWIKENSYYRGVQKLIKGYLNGIDGLFCANEKMLAYQISLLRNQIINTTGITFNPSMENGLREFESDEANDDFSFLYTGGFYGLRTPEILLSAFAKLLSEYKNVKLIFVGTSIENYLRNFSDEVKNNVIQIGYTSELTPFYERSNVLVDIDANTINDVFLSSKIVNYLSIKKPILCITGPNSPSESLFGDMKSIFQSRHNSEQVFDKMKEIYLSYRNIKYDDRLGKINQFYIDTVIDSLVQKLEGCTKTGFGND